MVIIDKDTLKILKFIRRKDNPTAKQILRKMEKGSNDFLLIVLCKEGYLVCTKDDGSFTTFKDDVSPLHTTSTFRYWATPLTNQYIEDHDLRVRSWLVPTLVSFISLVLSVITFLYAVVDKSPILVKLIG